ncbi:hypothetical protein Bbelb_394500 [Branchiostoma belcheri]|nr:hypothetical protein Bbelb_394500 [Branchiostoma belcheri]
MEELKQCAARERHLLQVYKVVLPAQRVFGPHVMPGKRDRTSLALLKKMEPQCLQSYCPVQVYGDGNCLYRAVSRGLFGDEKYHLHIRLLAALEMIEHPDFYKKNLVGDRMWQSSYEKELLKPVLTPGNWAVMEHFYAISAALSISINSFCPYYHSCPELFTEPLTRIIHGRDVNTSNEPAVTIMWSMISMPRNDHFQPDHFVVLHKISERSDTNLHARRGQLQGNNRLSEEEWPSLPHQGDGSTPTGPKSSPVNASSIPSTPPTTEQSSLQQASLTHSHAIIESCPQSASPEQSARPAAAEEPKLEHVSDNRVHSINQEKMDSNFRCSFCRKKFSRRDNLKRHLHSEHKEHLDYTEENAQKTKCHTQPPPLTCSLCQKTFKRKDNLKRHWRHVHKQQLDDAAVRAKKVNCNKQHPPQEKQCWASLEDNSSNNRLSEEEWPSLPHQGDGSTPASPKSSPVNASSIPSTPPTTEQSSLQQASPTQHAILCPQSASPKQSERPAAAEEQLDYTEENTQKTKCHNQHPPLTCSFCQKTFKRKDNLKRHWRHVHKQQLDDAAVRVKKAKCLHPTCDHVFYHITTMLRHLEESHFVKHASSTHHFTSMNDFLAWKEREETNKFVYFSKHRRETVGKSARYIYYICQNDGSDKAHRARGQPPRKTDRKNKKGRVKTGT